MMDVGTLKELGVDVGDVVECVQHGEDIYIYPMNAVHTISDDGLWCGMSPIRCDGVFRIITRAKDKPKLWRDMTPEEKGALLLAMYEGKLIEYYTARTNIWHKWNSYIFDDNGCADFKNNVAYRIKPEPKVETVRLLTGEVYKWVSEPENKCGGRNTHRITFQTLDGVPDPATIKMEAI